MIQFAEEVMQYIKTFVPEIISQGIIRVDIMEDNEGGLFVNELESLAANLTPQHYYYSCDLHRYAEVKVSMSKLYADILVQQAFRIIGHRADNYCDDTHGVITSAAPIMHVGRRQDDKGEITRDDIASCLLS